MSEQRDIYSRYTFKDPSGSVQHTRMSNNCDQRSTPAGGEASTITISTETVTVQREHDVSVQLNVTTQISFLSQTACSSLN